MRLDYDCYNGRSSLGVKYDRLDIDFDLVNKRDFPEQEEEEWNLHPFDWDFVDEQGEDVFDRVGAMVFGGSGWISGLYRNLVGPSLSLGRKIYRRYLSGVINYLLLVGGCLLSYELFANRRVHKPLQDFCCRGQATSRRQRASESIRDVAREERIRIIQERLREKALAEQLEK